MSSKLAFSLFDQFLDQLETGGLFVEIGTARDGGSTYSLQKLAKKTSNEFVTVDINPIMLGQGIKSFTMSGEQWIREELPKVKKPITLLFLDNFDWTYNPTLVRRGAANPDMSNLIDEYSKRGLQLDNVQSTLCHTKQLIGILPKMSSKAIVLLGDTWFDASLDTFVGKGSAAVYLLMASGYQVISGSSKEKFIMLGREITPPAGLPSVNLNNLNKVYTGPGKKVDSTVYSDA